MQCDDSENLHLESLKLNLATVAVNKHKKQGNSDYKQLEETEKKKRWMGVQDILGYPQISSLRFSPTETLLGSLGHPE